METKKFEDLSKGDQIKADLYSRANYMAGRYKAGQIFGLSDLSQVKSRDIFFLETLKVRADSADKIIAEAKAQGKNIDDPSIMRELGKEINALGKPIHRSEAIMTAIFTSLQLIAYYGIAVGIWGLVFKKSFLTFAFWGVIVGILISLLSMGPVIAFQRTKERIKDISFGVGAIWGNLGIIIGVAGLIAWILRLIFK